ncbi:MAG: NifB/NifX family molybdenum-iron cluster-binding protein [Candidatus Bathyarchaeota archaeon]|nr:NifB/NifX family molybdenum-iron cluster-binding protein [Candidatus Bathyarchaeum sp.]
MVNLRIAVATNGKDGVEDIVSNVFGRAKTFTIIDAQNEKVANVRILENTAITYHHGAGPIAVKTLVDEGVNVVLANELGYGAAELLKQHNVKFISVKPGTNVKDATKKVLHTHK